MWSKIAKNLILLVLLVLIAFVILNVASKKLNMSNADVKVENLKQNEPTNKNISSKIPATFNLDLESDIVLISNLNTGRVLFQQNADQKTSTASIAKLLSAIVVLENMDINEIININDTIYNSLPSKTDLVLTENIKIIDLLKMTLIMSSNDAVSALANHLGYYDFLAKMNLKANEIGMYNSHFDNPIGFDSEGNYSTAFDLFQLAKYVYVNFPLIGEITKSNAITIKSESNIDHLVVPTNLVVDKLENFWGGKTGTTPKAEEALLSIFEIEAKDNKYPYTAIIIKSKNRFSDIKKISKWIANNNKFLTNY